MSNPIPIFAVVVLLALNGICQAATPERPRECQTVTEIKAIFESSGIGTEDSAEGFLGSGHPRALVVDSQGNIYVGDSVAYLILKFDRKGVLLSPIDLQPPTAKQSDDRIRNIIDHTGYVISVMARDRRDNIYAYNRFESRVEVYASSGKYLRSVPVDLGGQLSYDHDRMSVNSAGDLFVSNDQAKGGIGQIFDRTGRALYLQNIPAWQWATLYKEATMVGFNRLTVKTAQGKQPGLVLLRDGKEIDRCYGTWINTNWQYVVQSSGLVYGLAETVKPYGEPDYVVRVIQMHIPAKAQNGKK
ncbi:hypothetical protein [Petrachloros mirabilis]